MAKRSAKPRRLGARTQTVDLAAYYNWPRRTPRDGWWRKPADRIHKYPAGEQAPWGIPFRMAGVKGPRVVRVSKKHRPGRN